MSFEEAYQLLSSQVLSHSHVLRLGIAEFLASSAIGSTPSERQLLEKLLRAEQVPLDVQGVRERTLRISRLSQFIPDGDTLVSQLCVRWLVAQLKVGLRPVWAPAAKEIALVGERCGETVWRIVFDELACAARPGDDEPRPAWMVPASTDHDVDDVREEERSWRDPSAHRVRSSVMVWNGSAELRWKSTRVRMVSREIFRT
jgi:U3 small nucleolar RNA-associated protein 20